MTNTHGGPRAGAGRPPLAAVRVPVLLPPALIATARNLGGGNVSEGIREALRRAATIASERRVEIWQDLETGAHYAVLTDRGRPIAACGPLTAAQVAAVKRGEMDGIVWNEMLADEINEADEAEMGEVYRRVWRRE